MSGFLIDKEASEADTLESLEVGLKRIGCAICASRVCGRGQFR